MPMLAVPLVLGVPAATVEWRWQARQRQRAESLLPAPLSQPAHEYARYADR